MAAAYPRGGLALSTRRQMLLCAAGLAAGGAMARFARAGTAAAAVRDGSHDFDFEFGDWKTHLRRLMKPLSGSTEWVAYDGTTKVTPLMGGRANMVELSVEGPAGKIEAMSLRLYEPATGRWSLNFISMRDGQLTTPSVGGFADGRGAFLSDETMGDRPIKVRFAISDITESSVHFEQAFSADGGTTWEVNWVADDTRV